MHKVEKIKHKIECLECEIELAKREGKKQTSRRMKHLRLRLETEKKNLATAKRLYGNNTEHTAIDYSEDVVTGEMSVLWKDVEFKDGFIRIQTAVRATAFIFPYKSARTIYNWVREGIDGYVEPIRLQLHSLKTPEILNKQDLDDIFECLSLKERFKSDPSIIREVKRFLEDKPHYYSTIFLPDRKDRSEYIKTLCARQYERAKFIPVWESAYTGKEECFIFTVKTKNGFAVILENCCQDRATYIAHCRTDEIENVTQKLFDYFSSDVKQKRLKIRNGSASDMLGLDLKVIEHDSPESWEAKLKQILREN